MQLKQPQQVVYFEVPKPVDELSGGEFQLILSFMTAFIGTWAKNDVLRRNESDFDEIKLNPRILVDVSKVSLKTKILGKYIDLPFGFAPSAMHKLAHQDGEINVSKISNQYNIPFCISNLSTVGLNQIQKYSGSCQHRWLQLYIIKDRQITKNIIQRAESFGFQALVITVDSPYIANRPGDNRKNYLPSEIKFEILEEFREDLLIAYRKSVNYNQIYENRLDIMYNDQRDASLQFEDIEWLKKQTKLPIILKGVQSLEDVKKCIELKIDAIWISNHGGRQLDQGLSTIKILSQISPIIRGMIEIYVDGGIRRGSDIIKCLALGANCVFIGRPLIYAQACNGVQGIAQMTDILKKELVQTMQLLGVKSIEEIDNKTLVKFTIPKL